MKALKLLFILILVTSVVTAREFHVAKTGNDKNPGTSQSPFLTIQAAANIAQPGDFITVHQGVYRERITPPRGGESETKRIIYRAAEGAKVEIKGSEIIDGWEKLTGTVWRVSIPNSFFGDYNPYKDLIHGDWFNAMRRNHHTGEVYLNGKSFWEVAVLEDVLNPKLKKDSFDPEGSIYTWYCESNDENTFIYANFHGVDPNQELVEINVRVSCFYPDTTNINYITIQGFHMSQAATQWAPPTSEQIGLIGTNWSKGWIIENNIISDSKCSGITLGKYGDEFDNTSANSAEGYIETVKRALDRGWSKENIGSHIVRNNSISDCEQTGICGSMGGIFSVIENNNIYNIWTKRQFTGAEMGGIKIHASINMLVKNNRVVNTGRGIWLDWMAQGARVTANICYNNDRQDFYSEVNHGPCLVDNNLFLSLCSVWDMSQGGAYAHNLMAGRLNMSPHHRVTPYHLPHSTEIAGYHELLGGDNRFLNNIFLRGCELNIEQDNPELETRLRYGTEEFGLSAYNKSELPVMASGNAYFNGALPFYKENDHLELPSAPKLRIEENEKGIILSFDFDESLVKMKNKLVTTELLGETLISKQAFVNTDNSPIIIDVDYLRKKRDKDNPMVGPFEKAVIGEPLKIKVW
ncbi:MAG: right-handed parallel beta-helix repeat-containing protein [Bacteroidota bacterium]